MSRKSGISWTDATWNVVGGCAKVSPACDNCYAIRMSNRMQANPKAPERYRNTVVKTGDGLEWSGRVSLDWNALADPQPFRWTKPRLIFVESMGDLFHPAVPEDFIAKVWQVMSECPWHVFLILTKRPKRMREVLSHFHRVDYRGDGGYGLIEHAPSGLYMQIDAEWPLANVGLGVTIENQKWADVRIPELLACPAAFRFVSIEPMLGKVNLERYLTHCDGCGNRGSVAYAMEGAGRSLCRDVCVKRGEGPALDWILCGGESGPNARPVHPYPVRHLRDQCVANGVPFHFKQWGEWLPYSCRGELSDAELEKHKSLWLQRNGEVLEKFLGGSSSQKMYRVGKKKAGRLLDGEVWDEFPEAITRRLR